MEATDTSKTENENIVDLENEDVNMEVEIKDEVKEETDQSTDSKKKKRKEKFTVFVGNLPFGAEEEDVKQHFKDLDSYIENVSIHTYQSGRSRGCCFVEFKNKVGCQKALKFNKTEIQGRPIRVEQTVLRNWDERREKFVAKQTKRILDRKKKTKRNQYKMKKLGSKLKKWKV